MEQAVNRKEKWTRFILAHPYWMQVFISLAGGFGFSVVAFCASLVRAYRVSFEFSMLSQIPAAMFFAAAFLVYPFVAVAYELVYFVWVCVRKNVSEEERKKEPFRILYDIWVIYLGVFYSYLVMDLIGEVIWSAGWNEQLYNSQVHQPIFSGSMPSIITIFVLYFMALVVFIIVPRTKRPPLVTVLSLAALYMGCILSVLMEIQFLGFETQKNGILKAMPVSISNSENILVGLVPLVVLLVTARIVVNEVKAYQKDEERSSKIDHVPILGFCCKILQNAKWWPVLAFVLVWPLLGIVIGVLALFGQAPSALVKAFTETADFTFSTKIPPQNLTYDEHYLCTVAAGGHKKIVKPLRMGKRHGHPVVVNRQLCVANAFEQILEEKTPRFHKAVRGFYDRYGFPVARLIRSKYTADFIWFLMKPLEWIFLAVLYLTDVHPEDRIAMQYTK